jgi:hypothetical protein
MTERMIILQHMRLTNRVACPKRRRGCGTSQTVNLKECGECTENQGIGQWKVKCSYGECKKAGK